MLLISFLFFGSFNDLISLAKLPILRSLDMNKNETVPMKPGTYIIDGFKIEVRASVLNKNVNSILGFGSDSDYFALRLDRDFKICNHSVFINEELQEIYEIKQEVYEEEDVKVFRKRKIHPLDIIELINLPFNTYKYVEQKNNESRNVIRANINWDLENKKAKSVQTSLANLGIVAGAKMDEYVSYGFQFDIFNPSVFFEYSFNSIFEFGIILKKDAIIEFEPFRIINLEFPLPYTPKVSKVKLMGLEIAFFVGTFFRYGFDELNIETSKDFELVMRFEFKINFGFHITKSGIKTTNPSFELIKGHRNSFQNMTNSELIKALEMKLSHGITMGLELKISIGDFKFSVETGYRNAIVSRSHIDPQKCSFPYLYGSSELQTRLYVKWDEIKYPLFNILDQGEKEIPLFISDEKNTCLFNDKSAKNQIKNIEKINEDVSIPDYDTEGE